MPRAPRANLCDVPCHLVHRGNNRQAVFFETADYCRFQIELADAARRHACELHAYVLMTNHVHLLATQRQPDGIVRMMQRLAGRHATHINRTRARTGTVWEGRYHASIVESDRHFFERKRYIGLNPVRASVVSNPADYRWSSFAHNALGRPDACITEHELYRRLGADSDARRQAYRVIVAEVMSDVSLAEIRLALRQNRPLGSELALTLP